jgi:hypothetical protein
LRKPAWSILIYAKNRCRGYAEHGVGICRRLRSYCVRGENPAELPFFQSLARRLLYQAMSMLIVRSSAYDTEVLFQKNAARAWLIPGSIDGDLRKFQGEHMVSPVDCLLQLVFPLAILVAPWLAAGSSRGISLDSFGASGLP